MGSPEIPETNENGLMPAHIYADMPLASDDSDNELALEDNDSYNGYQPLSTDENQPEDQASEGSRSGFAMEINNAMTTNASEDETLTASNNTNLPHILSADVEIEQEIWSQPRPNELQIDLSNTNAQLILRAMANFSLPNTVVPDWAKNVPEDCWKENLLQRIRARETTAVPLNKHCPL